jgi:hypothetical protein
MCALLSPVNLSGYDGFEEYYYAKRAWIFGTFLVLQIVDSGVALIKGTDYFLALGVTYYVGQPLSIILSGIAMTTRNKNFHAAFVLALLALLTIQGFLIYGTM